jgi:hypothetical protein
MTPFFGDRDFIGEEIVYWAGKPVWVQTILASSSLTNSVEMVVYDFLLKALMQDCVDVIPVRGATSFSDGRWKYQFLVTGDLANFSGEEEISINGRSVYRSRVHGGFID